MDIFGGFSSNAMSSCKDCNGCIISYKLRKAVFCDDAFHNMISMLLIVFGVSVSSEGGEISGIRVA